MSSGEIDLMRRLQEMAGEGPLPAAARGFSWFGEHARGWLVLGAAGALVDRDRRPVWLGVTAAAFTAHAGAVVLKRVVRRERPHDERVDVLVATPSDLSFPSAHVASTTAALVALTPVVGAPVAVTASGAMAFSRVLLGVHYPSDVAAGAALGLVAGALARRTLRRWH